MDRVQKSGHLHPFRLINGVAASKIDAFSFLKSRTSVGEIVLDHQVLGIFAVDERCDIGTLGGLDGFHVLESQSGQVGGDLRIGAGSDLVDHGPGEGNGGFIADVRKETIFHISLFLPFFCHGYDGTPQKTSVFRTVIHRHQGERCFTVFVPLQKHGCHNAHGAGDLVGPVINISLYVGEISSG